MQYGPNLTKAEINRLEQEAFLHIDFNGVPMFEKPLRLIGGLGDAELKGFKVGTDHGAGANADEVIFSKGAPTKLKKIVKLPTGQTWTIYLKCLGNVATAITAKDILVVFYTLRGKKKKSA